MKFFGQMRMQVMRGVIPETGLTRLYVAVAKVEQAVSELPRERGCIFPISAAVSGDWDEAFLRLLQLWQYFSIVSRVAMGGRFRILWRWFS